MRRIAIVSEHASPLAQLGGADSGGQNVYVANIARQLSRHGYCVDVFTRLDNPYLPSEMDWDDNVRIVHVPAGPTRHLPKEALLPYMDDFSAYLLDYVRENSPHYDIIHANFFMSAMAALPVARQTGTPLAVTFHALGKVRRMHQASADLFPDTRFSIEEDIVRNADCIIAECPQDRIDLISLYGADPARIRMVPCGYDPEELKPLDAREARQVLGWNENAFHILQLGRMVPRKGVDNVIRALSRLRNNHHVDAKLCVVGGRTGNDVEGDMPELDRLIAIAAKEKIADHVEFTGSRSRNVLNRYYSAADVFVTTPWYEPFGITPIEAMACSRPVIGSDTGGIRYTVVDGRTGFLVPPKDPDTLADRLATLANDRALAIKMGLAGARRAQELFTWRRVASQLSDVFEQLGTDTSRRWHRPAVKPMHLAP